jgi:hypothetical protein
MPNGHQSGRPTLSISDMIEEESRKVERTLRFLHWAYLVLAGATGFSVYRWAASGDALWVGAAVTVGLLTVAVLVDLIMVWNRP